MPCTMSQCDAMQLYIYAHTIQHSTLYAHCHQHVMPLHHTEQRLAACDKKAANAQDTSCAFMKALHQA